MININKVTHTRCGYKVRSLTVCPNYIRGEYFDLTTSSWVYRLWTLTGLTTNTSDCYLDLIEDPDPPPIKSSIDFLNESIKVQSERSKEYEQEGGERSAKKISEIFNTLTNKGLTEADIYLILQILKMVRQTSSDTFHYDSALDNVSYAALWAEALKKTEKK